MEQELASMVHLHLFGLQLSDNICTLDMARKRKTKSPLYATWFHPILDQVMANQEKIFYSKLGLSQIGHANDLQRSLSYGIWQVYKGIRRRVSVKLMPTDPSVSWPGLSQFLRASMTCSCELGHFAHQS
jgi:hypothetical protein